MKEISIPEMMAYCGLKCDDCRAYKATQMKDVEWKKEIAQHWSKQDKIEFKPEDVDCHGCRSDLISGFCRKICKVKPCAEQRHIATCAHCVDYACEKLEELLADEMIAAKTLEDIRKTLRD